MVDLSGYRGRTVDALHRKYGPVVRLAPNELSFSALPCIKAIYGVGSSCIKSPAYDNFGRIGMFQMQDPERHRQRQKRIAHIFAPSVLQQMEPLIQACVTKLVAQLGKRAGKEVDALHWCRMTVLDVGGESRRRPCHILNELLSILPWVSSLTNHGHVQVSSCLENRSVPSMGTERRRRMSTISTTRIFRGLYMVSTPFYTVCLSTCL